MLKQYILQAFDLKEEELPKTLLLQLNIFLIITTLLIVKPTINSMFLSELTANALPLGYVLTAIMAIIGSFFYNKVLEIYALNVVIEGTLIGSILSLILFSVAIRFDLATSVLLYIPYVWVAIFGLLTASQFWILANLVYNIREAKRVFGFIGTGGIAGGIFGGYLTALLASFLDTASLLLAAGFLLLICIPITRHIWKNEVRELNPFQISIRSTPKDEPAYKLILESKLLMYIALVVGLSVLIAKLVDYQYSDYASKFITDPEALASFFGFWMSTLSLISLLVQLFLTNRIVGAFGVGTTLLWLPSGIFIGSFLLLFVPQLWVVVLIKVVDGSLKQSVNKAATELLSIPIPLEIKKKTKTFTDVVVDSIATGLAGFILIFFVNGLNISSTYISLIIISLISVWLYLIYKLRVEYIIAFKALFEGHAPKKSKAKKEIKVTTTVDTVKRVLETGAEKQVLFMLHKTLEVKDERFFLSIKKLLEHPSPKVRAMAIENLYFLKTENLQVPIEEDMVHDSDQTVIAAAFRYLTTKYTQDKVLLFDKYLNSDNQAIANAALIGLSLESRNNKISQERFSLYNYIETALEQYEKMELESDKTSKICAALEAIGNARVEKLYDVIKTQLHSKTRQVVKVAITSAAYTLDEQFIDLIIPHLSEKDTRKTAIEALFFYNIPIIDIIYNKIKTEQILIEDAIFCIAVIEKFASQKAVNTLILLTDETEHAIKIEAIEALKRLKWAYPILKINDHLIVDKILDECHLYQDTLTVIHSQIVLQHKNPKLKEENEVRNGLIYLLEQRLDRQLQHIFSFLGVKYPPKEIDSILKTIIYGKENERIHAIEFLDNILDFSLKKELIPVTESVLIDTFSEEKIKELNLKVFSEVECYTQLLKRKDLKLRLAVLYLIEYSKNKKFVPLLEMLLEDKNLVVRKKAGEILGKVLV